MLVGAAQIVCDIDSNRSNLEKAASYVKKAADKGCRLVAFPEMIDTGYVMDNVRKNAGKRPGFFYDGICSLAAANQVYIACGMSERVEDSIYNSMLVVDPSGREIAWYRKVHLFASKPVFEQNTFESGDRFVTVDVDSIRCGLMICYDLRFPEQARSLMMDGAQAIILVSAWPEARKKHWDLLIRARAIENQVWMIAANRCGTDRDMTFCGSSAVIDPWGETIADSSQGSEELLFAHIRRDSVINTRNMFPVLDHRRTDIYGK